MSSFLFFYPSVRITIPTILLLLTIPTLAAGQSSAPQTETTGSDPVMTRIERARALAAAHQLRSAATELESVRAAVSDSYVRNITTLMLIGIYLEESNYVRTVALLDEAFQQRAQKDSARNYFALAGQAINSVRTRLARYRSFGININDGHLPAEAVKDIDQIRFLLERLAAQATEATNENGRAFDAWALKEDVLGLRTTLARDFEDRQKWQGEYTAAREKLASRQIQIASIGRPPVLDAVTSKIPNPFTGPKPADSKEPNPPKNAPTTAAPTTSTTSTAPLQSQPAPTPSPQASPTATVEKPVTTGSLHGRELKRATPKYPQVAKTRGIAGVVRVFLVIDELGMPTIERSEGPAILRQAAEDAARKWVFRPTIIDNKPVRLAGYLDFEFKL